MHLPKLRQLEFLVAIADHKSFSRAAEACHVSQPTLSSAIREVETVLGTQLIERGAREAGLTPSGKIAVERARNILADTENLVIRARHAGTPLNGRFRLGAIPTIAPFILPKILKTLHKDYTELQLYLREEKTEDLLGALRERSLDAAIIALPWTTPKITTQILGEDPFHLICPNGHSLKQKDKLKVEHLKDETVLLLEEGHCLRDHALSVCSLPGMTRQDDLAATSLQTMIQMVAGGMGVSLIPKLAAEAGMALAAGVDVVNVSQKLPARQIAIAWRTGSSREEEARLIGQEIVKVMN